MCDIKKMLKGKPNPEMLAFDACWILGWIWEGVRECIYVERKFTESPLKMRSCHTLGKKHCMRRTRAKSTSVLKYTIWEGNLAIWMFLVCV